MGEHQACQHICNGKEKEAGDFWRNNDWMLFKFYKNTKLHIQESWTNSKYVWNKEIHTKKHHSQLVKNHRQRKKILKVAREKMAESLREIRTRPGVQPDREVLSLAWSQRPTPVLVIAMLVAYTIWSLSYHFLQASATTSLRWYLNTLLEAEFQEAGRDGRIT